MGNLMERELDNLTPERMKEILEMQEKLQAQRDKENQVLDSIKSNRRPGMKEMMKPGEIPAMPRYGGRPRGMDKTPEQLKMDALMELSNRRESEALSEEKRRKDEEFESGYRRMGGSD